MSSKLLALVLVALAAGVTACGSDTQKASCNFTQACIDYGNGVNSDAVSSLQSVCQQSGGTFSGSECPTANRVGTCAIPAPDGVTRFVRVYTSYGMTAAQAQQSCTSGQLSGSANVAGTWTAG